MSDQAVNQDPGDSVIRAAEEILTQGISLLESIDDRTYTIVVPQAFDSTIGAHYRHCLDHFTSFLTTTAGSGIDYDQRERDPLLENDRFAALNLSRELIDSIAGLKSGPSLARAIRIRSKVRYQGSSSQEAGSTVARELMYVVAHGMHHFALIRIMARLMGVKIPGEFGVAPSTLQHRQIPADRQGVQTLTEE